jgi:hypothetical protein
MQRFAHPCTTLALGIHLLLTAVGCRSDAHQYQPPARHDPVAAVPADLGLSDNQTPTIGESLLDQAASVGRFPTGLSVVRVYAAISTDDQSRHVQVGESPRERSAAWSGLAAEIPALREVCVQRSRILDPRGSQWRDLLQTAREDDCRLCLIYCRMDPESSDAEYLAALWDTVEPRALAAYRVPVTIAECRRAEPVADEFPKPKRSLWLAEADFRAEADLRQRVRDTLWDLVARDTPEKGKRRNPWETDRPVIPRLPPIELRESDLHTRR